MIPRVSFCLPSFACSLLCLACGNLSHAAPAAAAASAPPAPSPSSEAATGASPLAEAATTLTGTWSCRGAVVGPEGPSPSTARLEASLALDDSWLRTELVVSSGKYPYAFTAYRTFEAASQTWRSVIVDNLGGHSVSRSTDGVTWTGLSSSRMGELTIRDTEKVHAPGSLTMLGQYSLDGGESWSTGYELSCSR